MPHIQKTDTVWSSPHGRKLPEDFSSRTLLMGIVNATPDSFSDGGEFLNPATAAAHAVELVADGADIIDIGAESTRPGAGRIDAGEELRRLVPVLKAIRNLLPDIPVSVDTYRPEVAEEAISAGADIINDVCAIAPASNRKSYEMGRLVARLKCPLIAMHNTMGSVPAENFWEEFICEMRSGITEILSCGVPASQLWLDPGFGFGKTPQQNMEIVARLHEFAELGFPVLLGTSRKSTLGVLLGGKSPKERVGGDSACSAIGAFCGAAALRLHDIATHRDAVRVADAAFSAGTMFRR